MKELAQLLGIDTDSPDVLRAAELVRQDREMLRALVRLREQQQLSQQAVADKLGLTQPTIAAFEKHDSDPKLSTIRRYAIAVNALIGHAVQEDVGQLTDGSPWVATTFAPSISTESARRKVLASSKRFDFSLAA